MTAGTISDASPTPVATTAEAALVALDSRRRRRPSADRCGRHRIGHHAAIGPIPARASSGDRSVPVGTIDDTWGVTTGSVAGFRVKESFLVFSNDVVGRTGAVSGSLTVADNHVAKRASGLISPPSRWEGSTSLHSPRTSTPRTTQMRRSPSPSRSR